MSLPSVISLLLFKDHYMSGINCHFVDFLPRKGNSTSASQHQTSSHWYNWAASENNQLAVYKASQLPPIFKHRISSHENKLKQAKTSEISRARSAFDFGEAGQSKLFSFSRHDNRHAIKAPEKKIVPSVQHHKQVSKEVRSSLLWNAKSSTQIGKACEKPDYDQTRRFRRFPKKHDFQESHTVSPLLKHENSI